MKKVLGGKLYSTETAKKIAYSDNGKLPCDLDWCEETLFITRSGNYFLYGKGGPRTNYAQPTEGGWKNGEDILPIGVDYAKQWCEEHLSVNEYTSIWGEPKEG